jgi:2,4-dienoyl-CoA reductase-like NADH-dependent reductase (Old Yellow Enzyme family)
MWRPPERIRYAAQTGRIPSRQEAERSRLFSPLEEGRLSLTQCTWVPAMVPWRATEDGFVSDAVVAWYERLASGRPGAIVVEATGIRDVPSGPLLRIGHDRYVEGLKRLVDVVKRASGGQTRLFIQIIDFLAIRRRPEPSKFFERFLQVTDAHRCAVGAGGASEAEVRARLFALGETGWKQALTAREHESLMQGYRERVTDVELPHIRDLPQSLPPLFAAAARRAATAGFDGVELHYAHAYTMASFISRMNTRMDGYGGTLGRRLRLPLEVFAEVRASAPSDFVVGCRFLAEECIEDGNRLDETPAIGVAFASAGMDFVSTSRGGKFEDAARPAVNAAAYPYTGQSGYECMPQFISDARGPFGRNAAPTRAIRNAIREAGFRTPVVCTGGVHNFEMAESWLAEGVCDIVGAARQSLADPDWTLKISRGRGAEVRTCEFTNYCEALDQKHKVVTCQLWDKVDLDAAGALRSTDGKRRLVAPDWPAASKLRARWVRLAALVRETDLRRLKRPVKRIRLPDGFRERKRRRKRSNARSDRSY